MNAPPDIDAQIKFADNRQFGELGQFLDKYRNDRLNFVTQVLGAEPEVWQAQALKELDNGCELSSTRSGHGVGKTAFLSWVCVHFVLHFYPCKCVITAPSSAQLYDALFSEIKIWIAKLPDMLRRELEVTSDRVYLKSAPAEAFLTARTARAETPEALQGIHAEHVLLVVDEASGVPEPIFEAAQGSMSTHGAITLLTGNPTRRSGFFYNTHTQWADEWATRRVSCFDSTRVQPGFAEGIAKRYGTDSPVYAVRVLGEFPPAEEDTFLPYFLIKEAMDRDILPAPDEPYTFGLDVARSIQGDSTALCMRQGMYVHQIKTWRGLDTTQVAARVMAQYRALPEHLRPREIFVDSIGYGAGAADRLREHMAAHDFGAAVIDINVSEKPSINSVYHRLRDELWGNILDAANTYKLVLPQDEDLLAQLTTPKQEFIESTGKLKLESKDKMKARQLQSPDKADALGLSFAHEASIGMGLTRDYSWESADTLPEQSWVL